MNQKSIVIRADANQTIAIGHVMRCMSIAAALKKHGCRVVFVVSEPYISDFIQTNDFELICLHNSYNDKESELCELEKILDHFACKTLLIDSYEVTYRYLSELHKKYKLIYVDDLGAFRYPVDMIINYSVGATEALYKHFGYDATVDLLLGPKYVPLREQFSQTPIVVKNKAENIYMTSGGTDHLHVLMNLLETMEGTDLQPLHKHIVVGKFYKDMDDLRAYASSQLDEDGNSTIRIYQDIPNVAHVMKKCDIAITAGGTTVMELCACGLPMVTFSIADNQIKGNEALAKEKLICYAGDVRSSKDIFENIVFLAQNLCDARDKRMQLSKTVQARVDGNGSERIAKVIIKWIKKEIT
ncbi:MAG: UDP-2,4-diacetamido-2,4,6-trideoxy-beta-L-altropyranose hydrolase [Lachnospiraceae bacterium]|nr:UDP-2,4-diacetamido-2,4,6-trideoxy-beta-L-altropyranose hydrolase [Lachnospiraceae bacterium]